MDRRKFLAVGATGAALSIFGGYFVHGAEPKPLRVGLIGIGWYGKSDLFRPRPLRKRGAFREQR